MPSQTCSREPSRRSTKRSRWMRLGAFALVFSVGSLLLWNDASTADTTRENRGFNRVTGSSVEPAQYVPGEVIVKFLDSASQATVAAAHALAGGQTMKSFTAGVDRFQHLKLGKGENVEDALAEVSPQPRRRICRAELYSSSYPPFLTTRSSHRSGAFTIPDRTTEWHSRCRYRCAGGLGYHHRQLQRDHCGHRHRHRV